MYQRVMVRDAGGEDSLPSEEKLSSEYSESLKSSDEGVRGRFLLSLWLFLSCFPLSLLPPTIGVFRIGEVEVRRLRMCEEEHRKQMAYLKKLRVPLRLSSIQRKVASL